MALASGLSKEEAREKLLPMEVPDVIERILDEVYDGTTTEEARKTIMAKPLIAGFNDDDDMAALDAIESIEEDLREELGTKGTRPRWVN